MDPVIIIQNDEPETDETKDDVPDVDFGFMLGTLTAQVETLSSRVDTLEAAQAHTAVAVGVALDVSQDAAQDAADAAQDAAETLDVLADALAEDDDTDDEFMPPPVADAVVVQDTPAEKPHPLFRSWAEWKDN